MRTLQVIKIVDNILVSFPNPEFNVRTLAKSLAVSEKTLWDFCVVNFGVSTIKLIVEIRLYAYLKYRYSGYDLYEATFLSGFGCVQSPLNHLKKLKMEFILIQGFEGSWESEISPILQSHFLKTIRNGDVKQIIFNQLG